MHLAASFHNAVIAIQIEEIDGELHADGVYGFTRHDPKTLTRRKPLPSQQTSSALPAVLGQIYAIG